MQLAKDLQSRQSVDVYELIGTNFTVKLTHRAWLALLTIASRVKRNVIWANKRQ